MPTLEATLAEAMQGSLSNELDESTFNGASGELNGLFTQASAVSAASAVETYTTGIGRYAKLVDGRHAYTLADVRAVIGSDTFALYAGVFANTNKGDVSLFDYLTRMLGSIRVSDRVPGKSSNAQKGIVVLSASSTPPKIHVWDAMQIIRDPYSGAGAGKVTLTATALVESALHSTRHEPGQGSSPEDLIRLPMALRVVQAPGCREIYSDDDLGVRAGDIVIDTGDIAASLGYDPTSPTANKGATPGGVAYARRGNCGGKRREPERDRQNVQPAKRAASARTDGHDDGDGDPADGARKRASESGGFSRMTGTGPRCVKSVLIGISTMSSEHHRIDGTVECREATGSPGRLVGLILPVGRVAGDRPELFVGSGVQTPARRDRAVAGTSVHNRRHALRPDSASGRLAASGPSSAEFA